MKLFIIFYSLALVSASTQTQIKKGEKVILKEEFCDVQSIPEARCGLCKCNKEMSFIHCISCPTIYCKNVGFGPKRNYKRLHKYPPDCCPESSCD